MASWIAARGEAGVGNGGEGLTYTLGSWGQLAVGTMLRGGASE